MFDSNPLMNLAWGIKFLNLVVVCEIYLCIVAKKKKKNLRATFLLVYNLLIIAYEEHFIKNEYVCNVLRTFPCSYMKKRNLYLG